MQGNTNRLLFYFKNRYLGHLNWDKDNFPGFITFNIGDKDTKLVCRGIRDWSHGKEGVYIEEGLSKDVIEKIAVGCSFEKIKTKKVGLLNKNDNDFLSSLGVKW